MASKIVVITGSRGRIGRIVARALLDSGEKGQARGF